MKYIIPLVLALSATTAFAQQSIIQKNTSYIQGGYAEEVMMQMDQDAVDRCDIARSNIETSLVSKSSDAKLIDGRLVSGKVVERWNVLNCNTQDAAYIVTLKGSASGMNDLSVMRQSDRITSVN